LGGHERGGVDELLGGVELAFSMDDLGAALALRFGLLGHGAKHGFGHVDLLDLNGDHLDAEGGGVAVDDGLDTLVEAVAVGEELVELDFAEYGAEGGLGELAGLIDVVGDLNHSLSGVDDAKSDDGVDLEGDVVAGDDVLGWDLHDLLAERDANHLIEGAEDQNNAGALGWDDVAEAEDDAALVLFEDLNGADEVENDDDAEEQDRVGHRGLRPRCGWMAVGCDCTREMIGRLV